MRSGVWTALVVLVAGAMLVGASLGGYAASGGIGDSTYAKKGCLCHGQGSTPGTGPNPPGQPSPATTVTLTIDNLTNETFVPGQAYTLTITVSNPSVVAVPAAAFAAGFGLLADAGTLANPDDATRVQDGGVWATHTQTGASRSDWTLTWTAPDANNTTFHFAGNKVNGNRLNDPLDQWNRATLEIFRAPPPPPPANNTTEDEDRGGKDDTPGFEVVVVAFALALAVVVARRRRT